MYIGQILSDKYSSYKVSESCETLYSHLLLHFFDVLYLLGGPILVSLLGETEGFRGVSFFC